MPKIDKFLNLRIQSPNVMEHWSSRYKRNEFNHKLIKGQFLTPNVKIPLPCKILLERSANRFYDHDNYVYSCKGVKDTIASLILGLKRGRDDDNPQLTWEYKQIKGKPGMRIEISWEELADNKPEC